MVTFVSTVELDCIDRMTRRELIGAIRSRVKDLPPDLRRNLDGQPLDRLQLVLLAARLLYVLRNMPTGE